MKKKIFVITVSLLFSISLYSQNINIPDLNFMNALIEAGVDTDGNLQIDSLEARKVTNLNLRKKKIYDLTGIESFVNLDSLDCSSNNLININVSKNDQLKFLHVSLNNLKSIDISNCTELITFRAIGNELTTLDISNNLKLEIFSCSSNKLVNIDISKNQALKQFGCSNNPLENLDISQNLTLERLTMDNIGLKELDLLHHKNLVIVNCNRNSLSTLDLSNNKKLESLMCSSNNLPDLDLSNNPELSFVDCSINPLSSLDLSNNRKLYELVCSSCQLTSLDLSNNPELGILVCHNNSIQSLDLINNPKLGCLVCGKNQLEELNVFFLDRLGILLCGENNLTSLDISRQKLSGSSYFNWGLEIDKMPQLKEVCVNELPFPPEGLRMDTTGSINIEFTMECTPILLAPDTVFQPDSIELLCSQDGMVYLVPENTTEDIAEIQTNQIDEFPVYARMASQHNLPNLSGGTYWLYAVGLSQKISKPVPVKVMSPIGLELNDVRYHAYPNPAITHLEIETSFTSSFTFEIFNLNGIKLKSGISNSPRFKIDISELNSGVYLVRLNDKRSVKYFRFIKEQAF